jgi:transaldolase
MATLLYIVSSCTFALPHSVNYNAKSIAYIRRWSFVLRRSSSQEIPMNPLVELHAYGQSFWYDNIRRKFLYDGTLQALIDNDGLRGMTSNPSIFQQAIGQSDDYDPQILDLAQAGVGLMDAYEALVIADIRAACDLFAPLYESSDRGDGYVSLEVAPDLAHDTAVTIQEARRLFTAVNRPNLMIKVPATPAGIPAIRQLISEGININITLMFSMSHYEAVAQAYIEGLTAWQASGGNPARVASVASFFVSRVDTAVDKRLNEIGRPAALALRGQAAVANCRLVYQRFKELFHGDAFAELRAAGGMVQRLLWASTSAKNPDYPDTIYIDNLIGPQTVNTMPPATVDAFRSHGRLADTLERELDQARDLVNQLAAEWDIELEEVGAQLQNEGVDAFARAFDSLLETLQQKLS